MEFVAGSAPEKSLPFHQVNLFIRYHPVLYTKENNGTKSTKNSTTNENQQIVFRTHNLRANKFKNMFEVQLC